QPTITRLLNEPQHPRHHPHVLPSGRRPGAPPLLQGARECVHRVLLRLARLQPAPEGLPPGGADQGAAEHARGAEGRTRGGRPPDRRARGDRAGDRDVRGARCGPAHLRALDPHPGPAVRARVDRDLRQARAPEVRHGPGAPHDAPARGGAQGAGGMSVPVCDHVLIGGEWVRAAGGTSPARGPATEEPAGHAPECSVEQVRAAARAARAAFRRGPWRNMSRAERAARLAEAAERFAREAPGLVDLTIAETGAVRPVAETQQVGAVAVRLARAAELATAPADEPLPPRGNAHGLVARAPIGVVACITPFTFPMTTSAGKPAPALACGNTVVVKPAPADPLGVAALCRIVAGVLPPGVLNFV